jgi:hypothetical protein
MKILLSKLMVVIILLIKPVQTITIIITIITHKITDQIGVEATTGREVPLGAEVVQGTTEITTIIMFIMRMHYLKEK